MGKIKNENEGVASAESSAGAVFVKGIVRGGSGSCWGEFGVEHVNLLFRVFGMPSIVCCSM